MNRIDIQNLRDLPIEKVAERLGLIVSRHKALCPFHDDSHPSLTFNTVRNTYRCFACGAHGGPIDLAMFLLAKPFHDACLWLANEHNIILESSQSGGCDARCNNVSEAKGSAAVFDAKRYERFFDNTYLSPEAQHFIFDCRRLDPRVIRFCRLTSYRDKSGIHWLQIPYYDIEGKLIGIQNRNLDYVKGKNGTTDNTDRLVPRFRFPKGSQCRLYNQQVIPMLRDDEPLFISEGCSDCWSLLSSGHKCVAIPSATTLRTEDLRPLKGRMCHIYPDNDEPGEQLYQRLLNAANTIGFCLLRHNLPADCKDYSDYYLKMLTC